jgi:DNA polymerase (family 10)
MRNSELCQIFRDIADLLELKGENPFKSRAYRNVVRAIEELPVPVAELVAQDRLEEIPGAGEAIRKKITELVITGHLAYYERLKAEFPEWVSALLRVPGIGPGTARLLIEQGIKSMAELEAAMDDARLASLPRIGDRLREDIRREIQRMKKEDHWGMKVGEQ